MKPRNHILAFFLAALLGIAPASADVSPETARAILAANQEALIVVHGVLKTEVFVNRAKRGEERETRVSASGFVVDSSGLAIVSRLLLNPVGSMSRKPVRLEQGGQSMEIEMRTRLENLRVRLNSGKEFPARVSLDDPDLALILLAPEPANGASTGPFKAVSLDEIATAVPFTQYLIVDQGEASFRNGVVLAAGRISGVIEKPSPLYFQDLGRPWHFVSAPFFDLSGKLLGMGLVHTVPPQDPIAGNWDTVPTPAILPSVQIREAVRRALKLEGEAQPPVPAMVDRLAELPPSRAADLLNASSPAVVVIEGSLRYKCGRCTEEHEEELEAVGTVLDPAGLVVMASDSESRENTYLEQNLRCVLANGKEIPFEILMHDDELLLTVLRPAGDAVVTPDTFKPLAINPDTKARLLDDVVMLGRLGKDQRYTLSISTGQVTACADKPRVFYQLYNRPPAASQDGLPVLTADGSLLGISAIDPESDGEQDSRNARGEEQRNIASGRSRIIPAAALIELLGQARKTRPSAGEKAADSPREPTPK